MAIKTGIDTRELDQLAINMYKTAQQKYPTDVKKFLRKEGTVMKRELKSQTKKSTTKRTGNLLEGITRSKVTKYKGDYQIRVFNKSPHAHLLEYGHVKVLWGKRAEGYVPGKHMFDKTAAVIDKRIAGDVDDFLDSLLAEGLEL